VNSNVMLLRGNENWWRPALAALIAYIAWFDETTIWLLTLLPTVFLAGSSRRWAFISAMSYYLMFGRDIPEIVATFFGEGYAILGWALWIAHGVLISLPWAIISVHSSWLRFCYATSLSLMLLTIPPLGLVHWASPLLSAGLFPAQGYMAFVLALLLMCLPTSLYIIGRKLLAAWAIGAFACISMMTQGIQSKPTPPNWVGINTKIGAFNYMNPEKTVENLMTTMREVEMEINRGSKVIVLPESILGPWRSSLSVGMAYGISLAKERGAIIVLGTDLPVPGGGYVNGLITKGKTETMLTGARVPIPIGTWMPWRTNGALSNIWASDRVEIEDVSAAVSICYEDMILWPHRFLFSGEAEVMLATANQWSIRSESAIRAQKLSRLLLAKIGGVSVVSATNR
jgi:apolipoprotein N-acyltransferase